jgi:hypothetical protein
VDRVALREEKALTWLELAGGYADQPDFINAVAAIETTLAPRALLDALLALELARGAQLQAQIDWASVPLLGGVLPLLDQGCITGASGRNWAGYGADVALPEGFSAHAQALLTDPQTSGGLLVACAPSEVAQVLAIFKQHGFESAAVVGGVETAQAHGLKLSLQASA